jgi:hypothetical protein
MTMLLCWRQHDEASVAEDLVRFPGELPRLSTAVTPDERAAALGYGEIRMTIRNREWDNPRGVIRFLLNHHIDPEPIYRVASKDLPARFTAPTWEDLWSRVQVDIQQGTFPR